MNVETHSENLEQTRLSLLRRLKCLDDSTSWNEFFNLYWKLIYSVARKAGLTDAEAQDVVQETVVTVAKNIGGFQVDRKRGSFRGWLLHITRWRIADQFRKRLPQDSNGHFSGSETDTTPTTQRIADPAGADLEAMWNHDWETSLLDAAMEKAKRQVDAVTFQLFHLHVVKQMPVKLVAERLEVKAAQVYFAKYKVSALIKKELKRLRTKLV